MDSVNPLGVAGGENIYEPCLHQLTFIHLCLGIKFAVDMLHKSQSGKRNGTPNTFKLKINVQSVFAELCVLRLLLLSTYVSCVVIT